MNAPVGFIRILSLWGLAAFSVVTLCPTAAVTARAADSLVNLIEWQEVDGGNGHWYAVLPGERYWEEAHALAATFERDGRTGYLATITSPAENQFLLNQVITGTNQPSALDMFWLDGRDQGGRWTWLTGEPFAYSNWSTGEPNNQGIETALGMWGHNQSDPRRIPGKWNNSLPDGTVNSLARFWALVEWGDPDTTVYLPPDTLINLIQWPEEAGGNDHWYAVLAREVYWFEANALAPSFEQSGLHGYLATVMSAAENEFILHHVLADTYQPSILDLFWLDGRDVGGAWRWLTNEPFVYTNWASGEPNNIGIETALSMAGPNVTNPQSAPGTWINALPDYQVNSLHRWWSVIEWGVPDSTVPPDTTLPSDSAVIEHLTFWPVSAGGNDHWYAVLAGARYWVDAHRVAAGLEHGGETGYLATITTPAENEFILQNVIPGIHQPSVLDMFWLGGRDFGSWAWITGEPFYFVNWSTDEPNNQGIETALGMWGYYQTDPRRIPGKWNNALPDPAVNPLARFWSLVEWGAPDTTFAPPVCGNGILEIGEECDDGNTVAGDGCDPSCRPENVSDVHLVFAAGDGSDTLYAGVPGSIVFSVVAPADVQIAAFSFPLEYGFTTGNIIGSIMETGDGARVQFSQKAEEAFESRAWNSAYGQSATNPDTTLLGLLDFGGSAWSGSGELWRIDFIPLDTGIITIDSATVPPGVALEIVDTYAQNVAFNWQSKSIVVLPNVPTGDVDGTSNITSADIVFLVNFIFKGGPAPVECEAGGDVNCSGDINAADIIRLIGYVFKSGNEPCNAGALAEAGFWACP